MRSLALPCAVLLISAGLVQPQPTRAERVQGNDPWSAGELIEPADLVRRLSRPDTPVVIQIGIARLYRLGHVPGSKYAGPASSAEGLDALKKQVQGLARSREVVFYCGCCPWGVCPNIRPAYKALREMGFTKIKVLHLPTNFTQDWATKGLPVEKGGG